ncbi:hypothetical protein SAMN05192553_1219 [Cyclobacterium xiamenense]|uniref:Uncharacterized protein n=1 Tax=Cyclobacterium xiamenense TaxID=1297121 RepID=A0A1H7C0B6_9BACT|nr:hypothetical protein [Cyclobacterium xiamenense]SEJ82704.1 hypothetical protein SAMN05192553_1219 [Cyclobacterium xiamenense]
MREYLKWFIQRIIIPVSWFASSVYITRLAVNNVHIEFVLGALVLVIYAVVVDFPKSKNKS